MRAKLRHLLVLITVLLEVHCVLRLLFPRIGRPHRKDFESKFIVEIVARYKHRYVLSTQEDQLAEACTIYEQFVVTGAPSQINISDGVRAQITTDLFGSLGVVSPKR